MRKSLLTSATFHLRLDVKGPLLIKSGMDTIGDTNMSPVLTYAYGETPYPYIPGTSLKGVLRSHVERIVRTLKGGTPVCLPYAFQAEAEQSCGKRLEGEKVKSEAYRKSCMACRLFGSLAFKGRTLFQDAYSPEPSKIQREIRDGVAIDRKTGGAAERAKYDLEVVVGGSFTTRLVVENFEGWQLGILALALRDMEEGRLPLGLGTSRGFGQIQANVSQIELRYPCMKPQRSPAGIESLMKEEEGRLYGLSAPWGGAEDAILPVPEDEGLWLVYRLQKEEERKALLGWSRQALQRFLESYHWNGGTP